jgi:sugar lactone lactonase YvrE
MHLYTKPSIRVVILFLLLSSCRELEKFVPPDRAAEAVPAYVNLPGTDLFPEGILAAQNGDLFVGGFGNGSLLRIKPGKPVEFFKQPGQDGLSSAVGLAIDEARHRLWVANFNLRTGRSNLKVFDVNTGALLATLTPKDDGGFHFFNEVALDGDGRAYVSDTGSPVIWTAAPNLKSVEVFVTDSLLDNPRPNQPFSLNGLAFTPDGRYLIASVMDRIDPGGGRLVRIDVQTRLVTGIELTGSPRAIATFGGSDGMLFEAGGLLLMVNVTPPTFIMTAKFSNDYRTAELVSRPTYDRVYNRATASAIRQGRLWTVNSQLDHIIDDENGALNTPPDLPFQLVNVSLRKTLGR